MDNAGILIVVLAFALAGALFLLNRRPRRPEIERVRVPTWDEAVAKRRAATPLATEEDFAAFEPPAGTVFLKVLPLFRIGKSGIHVEVVGAGARGDLLPLAAKGVLEIASSFLRDVRRANKLEGDLPRSNIGRVEAASDSGAAPIELGEVGGFDVYSRANEGVYVLLSSIENGKKVSFGPFTTGDLEDLCKSLGEVVVKLPKDAVKKSVVKIDIGDWKPPQRQVIEAGPNGERRIA